MATIRNAKSTGVFTDGSDEIGYGKKKLQNETHTYPKGCPAKANL